MSTATVTELSIRDVFSYDTFTRPGVLISSVEALCGTLITDRYSAILADVLSDEHRDTDMTTPLPLHQDKVLPLASPQETQAAAAESTWFAVEVIAPLLRSGIEVRALPGTRPGAPATMPLFLDGAHVGFVQAANPNRASVARRPDGRVPGLCTIDEAHEIVAGARRRLTTRGWQGRLDKFLDG